MATDLKDETNAVEQEFDVTIHVTKTSDGRYDADIQLPRGVWNRHRADIQCVFHALACSIAKQTVMAQVTEMKS